MEKQLKNNNNFKNIKNPIHNQKPLENHLRQGWENRLELRTGAAEVCRGDLNNEMV